MVNPKAMEVSVYVGNKCLSPLQKDLANVWTGMVGTQVQLFVPAVQMKPEIEQTILLLIVSRKLNTTTTTLLLLIKNLQKLANRSIN